MFSKYLAIIEVWAIKNNETKYVWRCDACLFSDEKCYRKVTPFIYKILHV